MNAMEGNMGIGYDKWEIGNGRYCWTAYLDEYGNYTGDVPGAYELSFHEVDEDHEEETYRRYGVYSNAHGHAYYWSLCYSYGDIGEELICGFAESREAAEGLLERAYNRAVSEGRVTAWDYDDYFASYEQGFGW